MSIQQLVQKEFVQLDPFESLAISNKLIQALNDAMLDFPNLFRIVNEFTLWLDVAIKLTNTANRVQATIGLLMPDSSDCTVYQDRTTVAKLIYFGNGNFGRLFSFDKTGNIDRTPGLVPLSETLNKFMAIYLYQTRTLKDRTHVFLYDNTSLSKTSSNQLITYIFKLLGIPKTDIPKRNGAKSLFKWRQHDLRALFLNRIGLLHEYQEAAFEHASEITRHTIAELHGDYVFWCRYYKTKESFTIKQNSSFTALKFPEALQSLHAKALQFCENSYLPKILELKDRPLLQQSPKTRRSIKSFQIPPQNVSSTITQTFNKLTCVGIDTSPLCSVVAICKADNTYEIHVYGEEKQIKLVNRSPTIFMHYNLSMSDRIAQIVEQCKNCIVAVERPLQLSRNVSKAQTVHTELLKNSLKQSDCFKLNPADATMIRCVWLGVSKAQLANTKESIKVINYRMYNQKRNGELGTLPILNNRPEYHPVSDIVDAVIVSYWAKKWRSLAHIPVKWLARLTQLQVEQ